jgi:hypothetical protein
LKISILCELKSSIDYSKNDSIVDLNAIISSKNLSQIVKNIASDRETENRKILKTISELSKEDQNINVNFIINENLKPRDITSRCFREIKIKL